MSKRAGKRAWIQNGVRHILLFPAALVMIVPFLWMVGTSFKMPEHVFTREWTLLPPVWTVANYLRAWEFVPFAKFLWNSFLVAAIVTAAQVVTASLAGYAFGRLRFPGRDYIFALYIGTMMIPNQVTLVPAYWVLRVLGLLDTYYALTLPFLAHPLGAFLMRQYFVSLPSHLEDAARIDGCSRLGALFRILLPAAKPAVGALSVLVFMFSWNDFLWPLIVTNKAHMRTVQVGLAYFQSDMGTDWPMMMAALVMSTIPLLLVFFFGQRFLVRNIGLTGLRHDPDITREGHD